MAENVTVDRRATLSAFSMKLYALYNGFCSILGSMNTAQLAHHPQPLLPMFGPRNMFSAGRQFICW